MQFGKFVKRIIAPGLSIIQRRDDFHASVLTETPGIHIHYFTTDHELEKKGWGFVHLVCHECSHARAVIYPDFDDADVPADGEGLPALRAERERFVAEHRAHVGIYSSGGGKFLCPPGYEVDADIVDLRRAA